MDVFIRSTVRKPERMSNQEFFGVWKQEAAAALEGMKSGVIKHMWKVPGKYEIFAVVTVDSVDQIDELIYNLPMWRLGYDYMIDQEWFLIRPYEDWAKQLEVLSAA